MEGPQGERGSPQKAGKEEEKERKIRKRSHKKKVPVKLMYM